MTSSHCGIEILRNMKTKKKSKNKEIITVALLLLTLVALSLPLWKVHFQILTGDAVIDDFKVLINHSQAFILKTPDGKAPNLTGFRISGDVHGGRAFIFLINKNQSLLVYDNEKSKFSNSITAMVGLDTMGQGTNKVIIGEHVNLIPTTLEKNQIEKIKYAIEKGDKNLYIEESFSYFCEETCYINDLEDPILYIVVEEGAYVELDQTFCFVNA